MPRLNPYINFKGNAREAMDFYKSVFGGKLDMSTFKDAGMPVEPNEENMVMHSSLETPNGFLFMASDVPSHMTFEPGKNISMSLSGDEEEELKGYWEKLSEGAKIEQPLTQAPWGDQFGMMEDKFGIRWLVNISPKKS